MIGGVGTTRYFKEMLNHQPPDAGYSIVDNEPDQRSNEGNPNTSDVACPRKLHRNKVESVAE